MSPARSADMIVDMRTSLHRSIRAPEGDGASTGDLDQDLGCIDVAVVVGETTPAPGVTDPVAELAGCVRRDPGRRVGMLGLNPLRPDALEQLDRAQELGLHGVAISPADQGYRPTHDDCLAMLERCATARLPVLVANPRLQSAESVLEFARPVLLDEVMRQLPTLTLIVGDFGHGWVDESLTLVGKHERCYAEISGVVRRAWSLYGALMSAFERGLLRKLLFGSGYPDETPERAIERIYTINTVRAGSSLPTIPREALRGLVERDALACLGIRRLAPEPALAAGETGAAEQEEA
ncbi:MAG: amidohydrolase family protein [Phycisphaerales bacterium]